MKRLVLILLVAVSLLSLLYFGYALTQKHTYTYAPQFIFDTSDQKVIRINRINEFLSSAERAIPNNELINDLGNFSQEDLYNVGVYISANRPILLFDKKEKWNLDAVENFVIAIKRANIVYKYNGHYLVVSTDEKLLTNDKKGFSFNNGDIKASYNIWNYENEWIKTDVYDLKKGFFEYRTATSQDNLGAAIDDVDLFAGVLPENITAYHFYSRFFAESYDSIYAASPMANWVNQGFVLASYNGSEFIITDNKAQQTPALVLLEAIDVDEETDYTSEVKVFNNIQLTKDFPKGNTIYLIEVEDKTIIAEDRDLAEKISLNYSLGETLALNENKKFQFFQGLPRNTHYRMITESEKRSKTWKNKIVFQVATLPPGDELIVTETKNWTHKPKFTSIKGMATIKDHIRGGASLFLYDNQGNYELVSQAGNLLFAGTLDGAIIGDVQIIDIFDNDKLQLLFHTTKQVYVLALNGEMVTGFPYTAEHEITTGINSFRWSNTFRCIFGTEKGEIIMLNQKGGELNIVQASTEKLTQSVFALNIAGNLRAWFIDENNNTGLAYLETPARAEQLAKNSAQLHVKKGSEILSFIQEGKQVNLIPSSSMQSRAFAEGDILAHDANSILIKNGNQVSFYDYSGNLMATQAVAFNEIGGAQRLLHRNKQLIGVYDYLENNYYLFDSAGNVVEGFPKETRKFAKVFFDKESNLFNLFTVINGNVICYKHQIGD